MTTITELLLSEPQPTRRDELLRLLRDVHDGVASPERALQEIEKMMTLVAQTAFDCAALTARAALTVSASDE